MRITLREGGLPLGSSAADGELRLSRRLKSLDGLFARSALLRARLQLAAEAPDPPRPQFRFGTRPLRRRPRQKDRALLGLADMQRAGVELLEAWPMADGQDARSFQLVVEERQHGGLVFLVEGGGRL